MANFTLGSGLDLSLSRWIGCGALCFAIGAGGCSSGCVDDGVAWNQKLEVCGDAASATESESASATDGETESASATMSATATEGSMSATATEGTMSASATEGTMSATATEPTASASATETMTASATETMTASATDPTAGSDTWCADADMDGAGDPNTCTPVPPGEDPPPGYVPNGDDCDDGDAFTFPGAAELDDPDACMRDEDDDGWGDDDPQTDGVVPGSDCDDLDASTFPGAAEIENPDACMKDDDDDGWGDTSVPPGVVSGSDCYDSSADLNPDQTILFSVLDNNQGDIGSVDPVTGQVMDYGSVDLNNYNGGWSVISTAVNPADGVLFGTNASQQRLVTFDYCVDGEPTNLMPHNLTICGLAFDDEGNFYGMDGGNDALVTLDPETGTVTDSKPLSLDGQPVNIGACGMAYDCVSTRMLISDGTGSRILSVDPSDGTATVVADIDEGSWNSVGLEFDPVSKDVFTNNGTTSYQIKVDGSNDFTQLPDYSQGLNDLGFGPICM